MVTIKSKLMKALEFQESGRIDEAEKIFRQILEEKPHDGVVLFSLALLLFKYRNNFESALALAELGIAVVPNYAPTHALRANILHELGDLEGSLLSYEKAIDLDPKFVTALINSSVVLQQLSRHQAALGNLQKALDLEPENPLILANIGTLLTEFKRSEEAISIFERLLRASPEYNFALGMLCFEKLHICDWSNLDKFRNQILSGISVGLRTCKTFPLMAVCDDPMVLHKAARIFYEYSFPRARKVLWDGQRYQHQKIRVAYVSADFREHPVGHLMAGVIEHHDKQRFEAIAISLGVDDKSNLRSRFVAGFDQFYDVQKMGGLQIAQLIRDLEVDIAIDLSGYTSGARSEIFAYRPAPIQVNYLGYPGTLGADHIDYILADRHVAPLSEQGAYSEKIVHLPHSYLPTDGKLRVADRTPSRSECGLPEHGFVFCSFNHDYKISPQIFAIWMRLLLRVEGSVLWLMKLNEPAQRNLCREAQRHGVDPQRLIFATRVPRVEDHLARYRLADLFLDCYPYNAHTTAADALFVGLPVLTYMGNSFQGRVAGSLLSTLEIPELISDSLDDYEAKAYRLAIESGTLAALKEKLVEKRRTTPLYDTELFCRHLESAYLQMWNLHQNGEAAEHFTVTEVHQPVTASLGLPGSNTSFVRYQMKSKPRRLHIGGKVRKEGWEVLNAVPGNYVDHVCNANDLRIFPDNSFSEIYASHVVEHFDYVGELQGSLKEWFRVLQPGGIAYISVPDLDVLCELIVDKASMSKQERFMVMRMIFGGHVDPYDYHAVGLNEEFMRDFLSSVGFTNIKRVNGFGLFEDTSSLVFKGRNISLNIVSEKPSIG